MIKSEIKITVKVPTTDKGNLLSIEPGLKDVVIISDDTRMFKVGINGEDLLTAIKELRELKIKHLPAEPENTEEIDSGVIFDYGE